MKSKKCPNNLIKEPHSSEQSKNNNNSSSLTLPQNNSSFNSVISKKFSTKLKSYNKNRGSFNYLN